MFNKIYLGIGLCLTIIILGISIRGNLGNPSASELTAPAWETHGPFELSPERGRFALTYSLLEDKSFYFSTALARFVVPDLGYNRGHYVSLFAPAVSYLVSPGYVLGKFFGISQVGTYSIITLFAFLNGGLIYLILRRFGSSKIASFLAGFIFLFASPAYAYAVNLYQHHISTFLVLGSLYLILNFESLWALTLVWFLCAFSVPVDYPNLIFMLPIGFYALTSLYKIKFLKTKLTLGLAIPKLFTLLSVLLPLSFFLWFNFSSYGNPLQFSGTVTSVSSIDSRGNPGSSPELTSSNAEDILSAKPAEKTAVGFFKTRYFTNGLYILLFSPDRGAIFFSPVLILAIFGIFILYRTHPRQTVLLTSIIVANLVLYCLWGDPWGGWAFGGRYLIPSYAILAIFLGIALSAWRKNILFIIIFFFLSGYSLYINTAGALSTSANPPQVQVLELEKLSGHQEKYTFTRNLDYLKSQASKSFVYNVWAHNYLSAWQYFQLVSGTLVGILAVGVLGIYLSRGGDKQ